MYIKTLKELNLLCATDEQIVNKIINEDAKFISLNEIMPQDLNDIIGKKGHRFHDDLTKLSLYLAKKHNLDGVNLDRLGVVMVTGYGCFNQGLKINQAGINGNESYSAQLFPNATFSSSAVNVSIALGSRGLNLTLESDDLGVFNALNVVTNFINSGSIDSCLLLVGDDYSDFTTAHYRENISGNIFLSSAIGSMVIDNDILKSMKSYVFNDESKAELFLDYLIDDSSDYLLSVGGVLALCSIEKTFKEILINSKNTEMKISFGAVNVFKQLDFIVSSEDINTNKKNIICVTSSSSGEVGVIILNRGDV